MKVAYKEGALDLEQVWNVLEPEGIKKDMFPGARFKAKITSDLDPTRVIVGRRHAG